MKIIASVLVVFLFTLQGKAQQKDTLVDQHYSIIKDPKKVEMPELSDVDFCQKFYAVTIPDNIRFVDDDGQGIYYRLSFKITFNARGQVLAVKLRNNCSNDRAIQKVTEQVIDLLKGSNWKIATPFEKRTFTIECMLEGKKLKDLIMKTVDNYQTQSICKYSD